MSEEEVAVENEKSGGSVVKIAVVGVLSLLIGYGAGAFTGQPLLAALGMGADGSDATSDLANASDTQEVDPPLFEPMAGVLPQTRNGITQRLASYLLLCLIAVQRGIYSSPFNSWVTKKSI